MEVAVEVVIWLHGDHLSATNPALAAHPNAPIVFVFDETFLASAKLAFHRLFFLYESVMDVFQSRPAGTCCIVRGTVVDEVTAFAKAHSATHIVTTATIGDRFAEYLEELEAQGFVVEALPVPSLVSYDGARVPKRFSVWWRDVETAALEPEIDQ